MNNPKKIAERRFGDARQLAEALYGVLYEAGQGRGLNAYVHTHDSDGVPASIVRLWEDPLTDGSKVYEVHIL